MVNWRVSIVLKLVINLGSNQPALIFVLFFMSFDHTFLQGKTGSATSRDPDVLLPVAVCPLLPHLEAGV